MGLADDLADDLEEAFPVFLERFAGNVYSLALRLCGPADAADVAQDAFLRAYAALKTYDPDRIRSLSLRPWVVTIALNVARNHDRARRRRPEAVPAEDPPGPAPSPHDPDLRATLAAALLRLPPPARQVVVLRHVVGLTTREVADALDRPAGTVKAQLARALAVLRSELQEER